MKASLTGDEPPDLQKYARSGSGFPYEPTDFRQVFDEEQFESYRCLGDHIARHVFAEAVERAKGWLPGTGGTHREFVPKLFSALQGRWSEPWPGTGIYTTTEIV